MSPDGPISSTILPPRKFLTKTFPTRNSLSSQIITDDHVLEISSWISKIATTCIEDNPYQFKLLVRGSRDGFDVSTIYNICDKVSNTVIILKVKGTGEILGGSLRFHFGDSLRLNGNLKTEKRCYCSNSFCEKPIRSVESAFSVEEYETARGDDSGFGYF
ncbi:hypothetical protein Glove_350g35 [Diversispora epigaea]|uniref:TLDc domain-containing protein n=1 Tax=Diversispora epigaea TaxID=1348612 RepID=A0A397HH95_9GLOM|nr:hypothetical protein Glove_350g35 [Diversispora epigaea]